MDPDLVIRAVNTEGGVREYAREGDFSGPPWFSGKSWWPFQLHYGGVGPGDWQDYAAWGDSAGMGNTFTYKTGWAPGAVGAWRDSIRFALDALHRGGWGPWYGPKNIGIVGRMGLAEPWAWTGTPDGEWDYKTGGAVITFNPEFPASIQDDNWSCFPTSLDWAFRSMGRTPGHSFVEDYLVRHGIVSVELGLLDASGKQFVNFMNGNTDPDWYTVDGYSSTQSWPVSWAELLAEITPVPPYPVLLGLRNWGGEGRGHWSGVRGSREGVVRLANPANGPTFGRTEMDRAFFEGHSGGASIVRCLHKDLLGEGGGKTEVYGRLKFRNDEIGRLAREQQADLEEIARNAR